MPLPKARFPLSGPSEPTHPINMKTKKIMTPFSALGICPSGKPRPTPPRDGEFQALPQAGGQVGGTVSEDVPTATRQRRESGLKPKRENGTFNIMKITTKSLVGLACFSLSQMGFAEPFEYRTWTNKEGKGLEAKLDHVVNSESVIIQAKNGGKRYTLKKDQLSDESKEYLDKQIGDTKKALLESVRIDGDLIYKGIALQLRDETETAAVGKTLSLEVKGFKISMDKLTATLCLESDVFATLRLNAKSEFLTSGNSLSFRSTQKGNNSRYWWYSSSGASETGSSTATGNGTSTHHGRRSGVDENSVLVATKGDRWKFEFSTDVSIKWGLVSVTEGPIITDR
jgi:hypothetical protein